MTSSPPITAHLLVCLHGDDEVLVVGGEDRGPGHGAGRHLALLLLVVLQRGEGVLIGVVIALDNRIRAIPTFNQALSVIVKTDGSFAALIVSCRLTHC